MAKTRDIQSIGIVFGDWKLAPLDEDNWELCHRHEMPDNQRTRDAGTAGTLRWVRLGRFYQWGTFANAIQYAADAALKAGAHGERMELLDALRLYAETVGGLRADLLAALGKGAAS